MASVPTTGVPNQLAATPDGHWVYVAINDKGKADIIDVRQAKVAKTLDIGSRPHNWYSDITGEAPRYLTTVSVGDAPNWLTFSPDGKQAYSANAGANSITIVNCETRMALKEIKVGPVPKRLLEVHPPRL